MVCTHRCARASDDVRVNRYIGAQLHLCSVGDARHFVPQSLDCLCQGENNVGVKTLRSRTHMEPMPCPLLLLFFSSSCLVRAAGEKMVGVDKGLLRDGEFSWI